MFLHRMLTISTLVALVAAASLGQGPSTQPTAGSAATQPAGEPSEAPPAASPVPAETIERINSLFAPPKEGASSAAAIEMLGRNMNEVMRLAARAEQEYPDAPNLQDVRILKLQAAHLIAMAKKDLASRRRLYAIADEIISSDAPVAYRFRADLLKVSTKLASLKPAQRADSERMIRQFLKRHQNTTLAPLATVYAHGMAENAGQTKLAGELMELLEGTYVKDENVRAYLRRIGKSPFLGQPFVARLTRLDGSKLTLPDDLKGKVVVIDFWAVWCKPCLVAMPKLKRLYQKYKDHGLEIVGISLDTEKATVAKYVQEAQLPWIHTFSGGGWRDATAGRYDVRAIPSVWLITRDGKVYSDTARGKLGYLVPKLIVAPKPTKKGK